MNSNPHDPAIAVHTSHLERRYGEARARESRLEQAWTKRKAEAAKKKQASARRNALLQAEALQQGLLNIQPGKIESLTDKQRKSLTKAMSALTSIGLLPLANKGKKAIAKKTKVQTKKAAKRANRAAQRE